MTTTNNETSEQSLTTDAIYEALLSIMAGIEPIAKSKKNTQQNYSFRGVDDIYSVLNPMLIANKVLLIPEVIDHKITEFNSAKGTLLFRAIVTMRYRFISVVDNSFVETIMTGEGMDSGDKATPKATSMAFKYMAFQMFCIPVDESIDAEHDNHEVTTHSSPTASENEPEKWLNHVDKSGAVTKEWTALLKAIEENRITSVNDVRKHYKVSKAVATEIEKALKS